MESVLTAFSLTALPSESVTVIFTVWFDNAVSFKSVNITDNSPPSYYSLSLVILSFTGSFVCVWFNNITPIPAKRITIIMSNFGDM